MKNVNKKTWFPSVYTILFLMAIFASILTWIVPAGCYDRVTEGNVTKVIAGTYHAINQNPQGPWDIFQALVKGFKNQASLIYMILFVGAAVHMITETKAIDTIFMKLAKSVKGKEEIAIFCAMFFMSMGGATGVFGNATLVLIPIGIFLSQAMGFDKTLGFFMIFFGQFSGFNVGWANAGVLGVAQSIAEVPLFSGFSARVIFHIVNFSLSYTFVIHYFHQLKKDPTKSLNYEPGSDINSVMGYPEGELGDSKVTRVQILSMLCMVVGLAAVIIGALKFKWGADHISATFLVVCFLIGCVSCNDMNVGFNRFIKGCAGTVGAAFIVGFANAMTVLMSNGMILDTIVYWLSKPISGMGSVLGAGFMFLANALINFFISSGSGQAAAVMPIMVPIADLTGITRQVAVQAFQFGDGFTNCVIPTIGTLMGGLGFAGISYGKYLKKAMPLVLIQIVLAFFTIMLLQSIGWTGL